VRGSRYFVTSPRRCTARRRRTGQRGRAPAPGDDRVRRGVAAVLLVLVLGLGARTIVRQRDAIEQGRRALSRAVADKSELMADADPELSRLLALAAWQVSPTPEAEAAMLLVAARPGVARIPSGGATVEAAAFSPDGRLFATAGDDVRLWGRQVGQTMTDETANKVVRFSPDGRSLDPTVLADVAPWLRGSWTSPSPRRSIGCSPRRSAPTGSGPRSRRSSPRGGWIGWSPSTGSTTTPHRAAPGSWSSTSSGRACCSTSNRPSAVTGCARCCGVTPSSSGTTSPLRRSFAPRPRPGHPSTLAPFWARWRVA
jgi:hypothetical protein